MRKISRILILSAAILFFALFSGLDLNAQEIKGFTLTPTGNIIKLEQSISNEYKIVLTNNEDIPIQISVDVFETKDSELIMEDISDQLSSNWVNIITERSFDLNSGESKEIYYSINFPAAIPQQLFQSTIFFNINTFNEETDSYKFLVKMPYLINFIPVAEQAQTVNTLTITTPPSTNSFINSNSIEFSLRNTSTENTFTKPIIYFQVLDSNSIPVYSEILNEGAKSIVNAETLTYKKDFMLPSNFFKDFGTYQIEIMSVDSISGAKSVIKANFNNYPYYYFIALFALLACLYLIVRKRNTSKSLRRRN